MEIASESFAYSAFLYPSAALLFTFFFSFFFIFILGVKMGMVHAFFFQIFCLSMLNAVKANGKDPTNRK